MGIEHGGGRRMRGQKNSWPPAGASWKYPLGPSRLIGQEVTVTSESVDSIDHLLHS